MMERHPPVTRRRALRLAIAGGIAAATGASAAPLATFQRSGTAFGTIVSITLAAQSRKSAEQAFDAGFAQIRHVERLASLTQPDSQISRLNLDGFLDAPDPALLKMLAMAGDLFDASCGVFDISVQPLWLALDAAARRGTWPTSDEIGDIAAKIDGSKIVAGAGQVRLGMPGMRITLNALAQGFAADQVAATLRGLGIEHAFVDTGELETIGPRADRRAWHCSIQNPRDRQAQFGPVPLQGCLATSGDYQYYWSPDFAKNHIVHPRTGVSPVEFASVSVFAASGLLADGLSTAVFLAGREKGAQLLERFGASAFCVGKSGDIWRTAGFPEFSGT